MKTTIFLVTTTFFAFGMAHTAQADHHGPRIDRIEDRIDRRESRRDERVDYGRRDVVEDRIDRVESRRDRLGKPVPPAVNRWERRSWRAHWARH